MRRYIITTFLALSVFLGINAEDFYFKKYDVTMHVHADNTYSISENMDAFFTAPRHGIVREWTTCSYLKRWLPGENGTKVEKLIDYFPEIEDIQVSENYLVNDESDNFAIQIGNADQYVEGDHHYTINYNYEVGDDRSPIDDVFYFSLLGPYFENETKEFTFAIHFDKKIPQASLKQIKLFYGVEGDQTDKSASGFTLVSDTLITGMVPNLQPHEAVTVYLPLPEGYYTCGTAFESETTDNTFWWLIGFAALLIAVVLVRECKSRNNFTKVIEYWPPKNLSSADLGYIYDTTVDPCDIISLIPYFAHKGLLTIDTTSGHPVLHKVKDIDNDAPAYQKKLFHAFFDGGNDFDTDNPPSNFAQRWLDMDDAIKDANKDIPNEYSLTHVFLFSIAALTILISMFICDYTDMLTLGMYGVGIFGSMAYIGFTSLRVWDDTMLSRVKRWALIISWLLVIAFQLYLIWNLPTDNEVYLYNNMEIGITLIYVMSLIGSLFMMRLSHMGKKRLQYIGHILGLKEFIEKSEKPLLDSLSKEHEGYFYDILPYAVAFGLSEKWAKQFEGLNVAQPSWYIGNDFTTLSMCHYMDVNNLYSPAMQNSVTVLSNAQARASASSHSGGGFSGGGFGGGGCHSW